MPNIGPDLNALSMRAIASPPVISFACAISEPPPTYPIALTPIAHPSERRWEGHPLLSTRIGVSDPPGLTPLHSAFSKFELGYLTRRVRHPTRS